jgi:uncharacterized protein YkwD
VKVRPGTHFLAFAACLAVVAAVVAAPASPAPTGSAATLATLDTAVLAQLNRIRAQHDLAPLRLDAGLDEAATAHTSEMLADGYFSHDSADGSPFSKRVRRYYSPAGRSFWSAGENLLWSTGSLDAARAVAMWMSSPGHRANILSPQWRDIGIAALAETDAPGAFGGATVTLITTDFGVRR